MFVKKKRQLARKNKIGKRIQKNAKSYLNKKKKRQKNKHSMIISA